MHWLKKRLRRWVGEAYVTIELLPLTPGELEKLNSFHGELQGVPIYYDVEALRAAVWPKPDQRYRILVRIG